MQPLTTEQRLVIALILGGLAAVCIPFGYWWIKDLPWNVRDEVPVPLFCLGIVSLVGAAVVHQVITVKKSRNL